MSNHSVRFSDNYFLLIIINFFIDDMITMSNMRFNLFSLFFKLFLKADFFFKNQKGKEVLNKKKMGKNLNLEDHTHKLIKFQAHK